jgi:hypothetical protein
MPLVTRSTSSSVNVRSGDWNRTRYDVTLPSPADKKRHQEVKVGIGVARKGQRCKTGFFDDNSQFLLQFTYQRLLGRLASLSLAAGKFPETRHCLAFGPLCNQHATIGIDECAGDDNKEFGAHNRGPL